MPGFGAVHEGFRLEEILERAMQSGGSEQAAVAFYRGAVQRAPNAPEAHFDLGNALVMAGQLDSAIAAYRRAIELKPDFADAHHNLGSAFVRKGDLGPAGECYRRAIVLAPEFADAYNNLGVILLADRRMEEALDSFRRAVSLNPQSAEAHNNLGSALLRCDDLDGAIASYRRAAELKPGYMQAHENLSAALKDAGRIEGSIASQRTAVNLAPNDPRIHSDLLYTLYFSPAMPAAAILSEHQAWNQRHARRIAADAIPLGNNPDSHRRLRVGYVSPYFREHPVGRFIAPLLAAHDRGGFEVFCYSSVQIADRVTSRIQGITDGWREIANLRDDALANMICMDGIDLLIDLTMHMAGNRLLVFARRPAPVQVAYLAYAGTTGLETMDYRLSDPYLDPPGRDESSYTEKTVRLAQSYWCYEAPPGAPEPARQASTLTFGCLNNFCKVSELALATWATILQAIPNSRLRLHAPAGSARDRVADFLGNRGIAAERLSFVGKTPLAEYLRQYNQIDICLDPFPYTGGTTTCDALWMGVPVVTLAGGSGVARGGVSILNNVGHRELIAESTGQYVQIANALAADPGRLVELRRTLRGQMESSPLMDAPRFARDVESAYRGMWRNWCMAHR
jgi:predicted O-linked N-acetylglucosamine transferase (SPINDLY family)